MQTMQIAHTPGEPLNLSSVRIITKSHHHTPADGGFDNYGNLLREPAESRSQTDDDEACLSCNHN